MGLDYSLCAIFRRTGAEGILKDLSLLLDEESRRRIEELTWSPREEKLRQTLIGTMEVDGRGISELQPEEDENGNYFCFSLLIQLETEMEKHLIDHNFQCFGKAGQFGCMWTSLFCGQEYVLLQMTAATTPMSITLRESQAIQEKWTGFAKTAEAIVAYLDIEDRVAKQLFPGVGDLYLGDCETLQFTGDIHFSVDRFVEYIRNVNQI